MRISRQRRLIFVHNQKTAGISMIDLLQRQVPDLGRLLPDHAYAVDGIARLGRSEWDGHYSFGFVRNPWARLVSWYAMIAERPFGGRQNPWWLYVREHSSSFEEFVERCVDQVDERHGDFVYRRSATRNQLDYFTDAEGREAVSFIGRYESIDRDFATVQRALGLPVEALPRTNWSKAKDYRSFFNDRTRELVAQRFARDISRFGYAFDDGNATVAQGTPAAG